MSARLFREHLKARPDFFVAQVVGESMNRRIPNGAFCLFRLNPGGSREGKIVLAAHGDIHDSDLGQGYTVKRYHSEKEVQGDGTWRHSEIRLEPDSDDDSFEAIVIRDALDGEFQIIAEFVEVLG